MYVILGKDVGKMRRCRNPSSSSNWQVNSTAAISSTSSSNSTNTVPSLLKELHGLVLQIQVHHYLIYLIYLMNVIRCMFILMLISLHKVNLSLNHLFSREGSEFVFASSVRLVFIGYCLNCLFKN